MLCPCIKQTEFRRLQFKKKNIQQDTIAFEGPMTVRYPFWTFITSDNLEY